MPNKVWKIKPQPDEFTVTSLAESLNISETLARLLVLRDIKNFQQAKSFFRPSLESIHDPFLMNGMECATTRVIKAITENELIYIFLSNRTYPDIDNKKLSDLDVRKRIQTVIYSSLLKH